VLLNPKEMAAEPEVVEQRLAEEKEFYAPLFHAAFGDETISFDRVVLALATFQRSLKAGRTDFDKFLGGRRDALSDEALAGLHLFRTDARCMNCHNGPEFTDHQFHNVGFIGRRKNRKTWANSARPDCAT
jgi:cytochrome c peroxidase